MIEAYLAVVPVGGAVLISLCVSSYMRFRYRRQPVLDLAPPERPRPSHASGPQVALDEPDSNGQRGQRRHEWRDGMMPPPSATEGGNLVVLDE